MSAPPTAMKALTIWQPWASLIACGGKVLETRSWPPPASLISKKIAIHAAFKAPAIGLQDFEVKEMEEALQLPQGRWHQLPFGAVVAIAKLEGGYQVKSYCPVQSDIEFRDEAVEGSRQLCGMSFERFGDFRQGRWCWYLTDIEPVGPYEARGQHGLWDWKPPEPVQCHG